MALPLIKVEPLSLHYFPWFLASTNATDLFVISIGRAGWNSWEFIGGGCMTFRRCTSEGSYMVIRVPLLSLCISRSFGHIAWSTNSSWNGNIPASWPFIFGA